MNSRQRERGFTALEITVVVLIIATIMAIAIPNIISATRSYKLQIAADAVAQQLNRTRQEAVRANIPKGLLVGTNSTQFLGDPDPLVTADDETAITISSSATVTPVPSNATTTVIFTSRGEMPLQVGQPSISRTFKVVYSGKKRVITVDPRGAIDVGGEQPDS
jgi:prepilin-type N-terminal cleavage/methylation domain-containing protein